MLAKSQYTVKALRYHKFVEN